VDLKQNFCRKKAEPEAGNKNKVTKVSKLWNIKSNFFILKELFFSNLYPHYGFWPPGKFDAFKSAENTVPMLASFEF
jgi:hypothetical protein